MKPRAVGLVFLGGALLAHTSLAAGAARLSPELAQDAASTKTPSIPIIKVGLDLIQIDAVVTDAQGRPVADLRPEDFSIQIDGKKQTVDNAMFFNLAGGASTPSGRAEEFDAARMNRSVIFLVDDLNMSHGSMYLAKRAMQSFAKGFDSTEALLAVRSTSDEGESVLLSRKPERFDEAINALRYNIRSSRGVTSGSGMQRDATFLTGSGSGSTMSFASTTNAMLDMSADFRNPAIERGNLQQRVYSLLTTVNALRSVPGRKAVVFVSEGFELQSQNQFDNLGVNSPFDSLFDDNSVNAALRMIIEVANRASVVIYTLDPSGLAASGPGADVQSAPPLGAQAAASFARFSMQGTLRELADDTGGLSVYNRNDLKGGFHQVVDAQRSYYLVGFEPPKEAFTKNSGKPKFHKIKLTVNRPGLRVRTRAGFYGVTDQEVVAKAPLMVTPEP